jgi:2'-5' RNA ligase
VNGERARLFTALELPEVVTAALVQWRSERLTGVSGLRLTRPEGLHVTLCFLGSQPVEEIDPIAAACVVVAQCRRPVLSLADPLWLPPRRPRVVAIALEDQALALAELQTALAGALEGGGWYEPERRAFRPHVTVARASGRARLAEVELSPPVPIRFVGSSVVLMRSRTAREGARYERLCSVSLSAVSPA